jgi:hypothetical protein
LASSLNFYLNIDYDEQLNPKKYPQFQVSRPSSVARRQLDLLVVVRPTTSRTN